MACLIGLASVTAAALRVPGSLAPFLHMRHRVLDNEDVKAPISHTVFTFGRIHLPMQQHCG